MAASNPFASRFLRPGVVPFLFPEGDTADTIVQRLAHHRWWGQIVGPHGSGKSTLLMTLIPAIERVGRQPSLVTLHQGQRQMPTLGARPLSNDHVLMVDGYEQLSWWSKWQLQWRCRRTSCGLLVTSHRQTGLPLLCRTTTSLPLLEQIATRLLSAAPHAISRDDLAAAYESTGGNLRESLFRLYDVYQERLSNT